MGCGVKRQGQRNPVRNRKRFLNEAFPVLAISAEQLRAIAGPAAPMHALAGGSTTGSEAAGRSIRSCVTDPNISRRINDALEPGSTA